MYFSCHSAFAIVFLMCLHCSSYSESQNVKTWDLSDFSFAWPCQATKNVYERTDRYIPENIIATRGQMDGNFLYLCMPRFKHGVPSTLVKAVRNSCCSLPTLVPFPNLSLQEEGNCDALQSAVDIFLDHCGILWILDTGIVGTMEIPTRKCPPKVMAISVKSGKILHQICLDRFTTSSSRLQYLVVDHSSDTDCRLYLSDAARRSIIIYDVQLDDAIRVLLPRAVSTSKEVLYLALAKTTCDSNILYFSYLDSPEMFALRTADFKNGNQSGQITSALKSFSLNWNL